MKVVIRYSSRTDIFNASDRLEHKGVEHNIDNIEMDLEISGLSGLIKKPGKLDLYADGTNIGKIPANGARIVHVKEE